MSTFRRRRERSVRGGRNVLGRKPVLLGNRLGRLRRVSLEKA